jgi:hypothetical protein
VSEWDHPESSNIVDADLITNLGKAEGTEGGKASLRVIHRGRRLRHVSKGNFVNLGDPVARRQEVGNRKPKGAVLSYRKSDYVIVLLNRVMIGEERM